MDEQKFLNAVNERSAELKINPLLLLSGIEGIYTFREIPLNKINFQLLDSLILTILALRIGDKFHQLSEQGLMHPNDEVRKNALRELDELSPEFIESSGNPYLQSFAQVLNGKSPVRAFHIKALEASALEIRKAQLIFENESIGEIIMAIGKNDPEDSLGLSYLFNQ